MYLQYGVLYLILTRNLNFCCLSDPPKVDIQWARKVYAAAAEK
jgi:hypothetical protein